MLTRSSGLSTAPTTGGAAPPLIYTDIPHKTSMWVHAVVGMSEVGGMVLWRCRG